MNSFPKKYQIQDLHNRAKNYNDKNLNNNLNDEACHFFINLLPISQKLSYKDFFSIYMNDFISQKKYIENQRNHQNALTNKHLFIVYGNELQNICSSYEFFNRKNQTLSQIGTNKLERHIASKNKKNFNANKKILDSYLSSPHKIYIPDSNMYLYILDRFHVLRDNGRITKETKIGYRSFDLQTSIPSQNILRKEEKVPCYTLKYFVGAKCEALPVCVEDIDLCCGDVALLVHPKDKRYNKFIGKNAIIPLCNRQIPIIGDENVNIAIDNGIQRICPCSNQKSIALAEKYGLPTNIYVFDKQGLYTDYIHEPAFIGQERSKYYTNIVGFISDIGNLAETGEKLVNIPYLDYTGERLTPYKIEELIIDFSEEKEKILNQIFEGNLKFSFLHKEFGDHFKEISLLQNELDKKQTEEVNLEENEDENGETNSNPEIENGIENLKGKISQLKEEIIDYIDKYLPNNIICNSQLPFGWRIPILENKKGEYSFFDIEKDCKNWKDKPLQFCFNFVLLALIREGTFITKTFGKKIQENKLCDYDKFFIILSQNEKKIQHFVQHLSNIVGENPEYDKFLNIIQNLIDDNSPTINECAKLIKNCKFITQEGGQLLLNIEGISNDVIDPNFIQLCIPCYLNHNNIKLHDQIIIDKNEKSRIFKELLVQELILGKTLFHEFIEYSCTDYKILGDKQSSKTQIEQSQRELFSTYGENPIRLNFLIDQTYDQKEILLNNIFLKQIRNAVRLCIQKDFLPKNIEECLDNQPQSFEDFDTTVLYKLEEFRNDWENIENYEEYLKFFGSLKKAVQNIFFARYLEIQKVHPTKDVQFVCSYFFNFLFTILYPLTPEFVDALQYVSKKSFMLPIKPVESCKAIDYNMNFLFNIFIKIKELKIEHNIQQHESCNMFIKSNPSILDVFNEHEQIFKNYFHISEISYLRLHEPTPLGYEIFSDETLTIGLQSENMNIQSPKNSIETIERDIKNLEDKLDLLRQRIQLLPEGEQRSKTEEEYAKTKEEIEKLTIKHSILSSK